MTDEQIEAAARALCLRVCTAFTHRESCDGCSKWIGYVPDAKAALTAAEAASPPVYKWQPISTLEHGHVDDSKVILPSGRPCPAAFESDHVLLVTAGHGRPWVGQSMILSGVLIGWGGPAPTHWMPLPQPPKEASDD